MSKKHIVLQNLTAVGFTPVGGALNCGVGRLGFDSRGWSNTLGLSLRN